MKSRVQLIALGTLLILGTTSFGQSLNFSGGFTTSTLKADGMSDGESTETFEGTTYTSSYKNKNLSGFNAAIGYEFRLSERLSLETGLKYQTRGFQQQSEFTFESGIDRYSETSNYRYKMNYLDLPIVLNTAILLGDVKVYARTGIYVGLLTGAKYSYKSEYSSTDGDNGVSEYSETLSGNDIDERITGGFVFGAGIEFKNFYFETNYNLGAYSIADLDEEVYTHDLSFSMGYKIKFKK